MSSSSEAASGTNGKASASASASHRGQGAIMLMKELKGARATGPATVSRAAGYRGSHGCHPYLESRCRRPRAGLKKSPVEGFSAGLRDESNPFIWDICIMGPPDSP